MLIVEIFIVIRLRMLKIEIINKDIVSLFGQHPLLAPSISFSHSLFSSSLLIWAKMYLIPGSVYLTTINYLQLNQQHVHNLHRYHQHYFRRPENRLLAPSRRYLAEFNNNTKNNTEYVISSKKDHINSHQKCWNELTELSDCSVLACNWTTIWKNGRWYRRREDICRRGVLVESCSKVD